MHASAPPPTSTTTDWQALTSPRRLPGLSAHGQAMLRRLREHPAAPCFRDMSGHRLGTSLRWQALFRQPWLLHAPVSSGTPPAWVWPWLLANRHNVADWPDWRTLSRGWHHVRTTCRADLSSHLIRHVSRRHVQRPGTNEPLLCFSTSGTTGHPLRVPSSPLAAAAYAVLHERALRLHGVRTQAGRGDVGIVLVGFQQRCFTYVSVNPMRGECGLAKVNLHPGEWRHPDDRATYLDAMAPELISGDPVSLSELATLGLRHRPQALLSTSMAMSDGLQARLSAHFGCPVVDLYSMNEAGPIAARVPEVDAFVLLQPGLHVEVLDDKGRPVPAGERGEVTLTGGINPCLPLLRYRTGDHARLVWTPLGPALRDLQGRPPVSFQHADGSWVNNVELSQRLRHLDLQRHALHQHSDRSLVLRLQSDAPDIAAVHTTIRQILRELLGELPLRIEALQADDKVRQYTSDLKPPHVLA